MPDEATPIAPPVPAEQRPGFLARCRRLLTGINDQFHFFVSLPVVTVVGSLLASHFQYLSTYQDKVDAAARQQISAAEGTYADVSGKVAKAVTLQQYLFFDFRDALTAKTFTDENALETKDARAVFPQYDALRIDLRESIDLLARKVERDLDWHSDRSRDAAKATIGGDPMSRIALGAYDFECEGDGPMPDFHPGRTRAELQPPQDLLKVSPGVRALVVDWYSTKHQLLTLYYCFEVAHRRITAARQWAAGGTLQAPGTDAFRQNIATIRVSFNREAERLNAFLTLAARRIELIEVKFRPNAWYCHVPLVREIIDAYSKSCTPIHTAQTGSVS
jgi:hypothetical protein